MADYAALAQTSLEAVRAVGGAINIIVTGEGEFYNIDAPWEGSSGTEEPVLHVAALVPFSSILSREADPFKECAIIPAAGLEFEIVEGSVFTDAGGKYYRVANVLAIRPDMVVPVVYICEVTTWPGT